MFVCIWYVSKLKYTYKILTQKIKMIGVTTAIIQDTRIKRQDGTYAIKLRLTYNREQKYYPIGKFLSKEDWQTLKSGKHRNKKLKELEIYFAAIENKAVKIIDKMNSFSFPGFINQFNAQAPSKSSVLDALKLRRQEFIAKNSINTAVTFQSTIKSIEEYIKTTKKKKLSFFDVTPEWLKSYEGWMLATGRSNTTIGMYLRNLRTVVNKAIDDGMLPKENYPFSKSKYRIPSARNIKKALTGKEIKQLMYYSAKTKAEERARDLWLFSYLCNGINTKDIAKLKHKNIDSEHIYFVRSKTEHSTISNQKLIIVYRLPEINTIIKKWGTKNNDPEGYVFPILSINDTPEKQNAKIKQAVKTINKYTKRIGKELGFELSLTTYVARHSFATILKRNDTSIEYISESLGHSNLQTTENYLDSFDDETRAKNQRKLLDF